MTSFAEKIPNPNRPHFDFGIDNTVSRIREHALALDRCKRYTEVPRLSFECDLKPIEWAVFAYYYSLAPKDHPNEWFAAERLKVGRTTLAKTLSSLRERGMIFYDTFARSKLKIVNIAHPAFWNRKCQSTSVVGNWINPATHVPRQLEVMPERTNEAREFSHVPGNHIRLPYLLFQTPLHPTAKYIYGLLCYLDVNVHPTLKELASSLNCSTRTVSTHIAELEDCRMIYTESRDPEAFGDHSKDYYHLTDVALWRTTKAGLWYPGGENSLIVRLDTRGFADHVKQKADHDLEEFKPLPNQTPILVWNSLRQESSQVRQESSQVRQESSQVRQESSQVRQESSQVRQESSQVRQESSQVIEKSASNPYPEPYTEDSDFAKNTYINKTNNKNTVCKSSHARRWAPVDAVFHPRLINIAKVAEIAWKERDYRFDRALWNGAVEQVAIEMGERAALEFASFVKKAYYAYGRPFPYNPYLIQQFVDAFREGRSWATVLGHGYSDPEEVKPALEGETQKSLPETQASLLIDVELIEQGVCTEKSEVAQDTLPGVQEKDPESGKPVESENPDHTFQEVGHVEPLERWREEAPVTSQPSTPEPQENSTSEKNSAQERHTPPRRPQVQITHANLLDVPLAMIRPTSPTNSTAADTVSDQPATARAQSHDLDIASEKTSAPRSPSTAVHTLDENSPAPRSERRIQLERAASILTTGLKCQASFQLGWAKLNDDQLYNNLLHMFGAEKVQKIAGGGRP